MLADSWPEIAGVDPCCRVSDTRGDVQWRRKPAEEPDLWLCGKRCCDCLDYCFSFAADFALAEAKGIAA